MSETVATLKETSEFFEFERLADFRREWGALSEDDKTEIRSGIGNGSLTY